MEVKESPANARIGSGKPGPGRPRGVPNKLTRSAREAFELAFQQLGGAAGLARWAAKHPSILYALYSKLIPGELNVRAAPVRYNVIVDRSFELQQAAVGTTFEHSAPALMKGNGG
jgi:hypothetical protein